MGIQDAELDSEKILSVGIVLMQYVGIEFENNTFGTEGSDGITYIRASIPKESTMSSMDEMLKGIESVFGDLYQEMPRTKDDYAKIIKETVIKAIGYDGTPISEEELKVYFRFFVKVRDSIWSQEDAHDFYKKLSDEVYKIQKKFEEYEEV